jgi:hypothetical protein
MKESFGKKNSTNTYPGTKKVKIIPIIIFIAVICFFVYFVTSAGNTPYNYFTRLANAFLHGKYYLSNNPPWLSELIPISTHMWAVVYPPAPAILLMPFIAFFGVSFPQQIFAHLIGFFIILTTASLAWNITKDSKKTLYMSLLAGLGTILWFMSATGSVWLLGQTTAILFLLLSILILTKNKSPILIGALIGIAFLARVEIILALPFFFFQIKKRNWQMRLGLIPFVIFYIFYNYLRFGNLLQTGYSLIPGVLQEPWYSQGIINYSYIPNNLKVMFAALPIFQSSFPFVVPSWGGLAIWITTPTFIYAFFNNIRQKAIYLSWLAILSILLIISMHGETGYAQFGYRFAADFYPFLFFLIIKYLENHRLSWHHWLLLFLSIFVNLWGVTLINILHIVAP